MCKNKWCKVSIKITPTCFGVNKLSSGSLQVVLAKVDRSTTQKPNQEFYMRPHLPRFYHNDTLLYFILSF